MSEPAAAEITVRVLLEIDNLATAGGQTIYLVHDEVSNRHGLARRLPGAEDHYALESKWINHARMTEFAYRVAGGDPRALSQPGAVQAFAIVLLAAAAHAAELNQDTPASSADASRTSLADASDAPPAPRGQTMLQLDAPANPKVAAKEAIARGFTGDMCSNCTNFTMKRNGTCLVCATCGATTGCS